jgi:tetratricopeptide (TPR) repeat protein
MNENIKKIEFLLSKDTLSKDDQEIIKEVVAKDSEAKDFYEKYVKLQNIVHASSHLNEEEIGEYILSKKNNQGKNRLSPQKIKHIEEHIKNCKECSKLFLELDEEFSEVTGFVEKSFGTHDKIQPIFFRRKIFGYSVISVLSIAAVYLIMMTTSLLVTPKTTILARVEKNEVNYVTRGRASDEFQKGLAALDNDNYLEAINYFTADVEKNTNDETIFYTHYILGLTYLKISEKNFLGMFPTYDKSKVEPAIQNFEKCISENTSGNYPDISANSYFYIGKAELMLGNKMQAKNNFNMVIMLKGSKVEKAKEILKELE